MQALPDGPSAASVRRKISRKAPSGAFLLPARFDLAGFLFGALDMTDIASIGLKMETDGLEKGIRVLRTLADTGPRVERAMDGVADTAAKTNSALGRIGSGASGFGVVGKAADDAAKKLGWYKDAQGRVRDESGRFVSVARQVEQGLAGIAYQSAQSATGFQSLAGNLRQAASGFSLLQAGVQGFLGLQVVGWAKDSAAALYQASAAAERLRIGLDFASARGSAAEIDYLRKSAYDLGLQFGSTARAYMQFQAAARGTAIEGDKARAVFESIAKASAVMGLSADQSAGVLLALQQMVSKGTVQAEELRGQLGERLPGAFQIAAKAMGVTTAELGKMLEQGQVIADDFLPKFAKELERSLGDAPEKAANRLDASVNRVNDAWERLKQNVGDSGFSQFWAGQMNILTDGMGNFNSAIEEAKASGAGFGGQLLAAAGAALEFINPLNAISYSALDAGNKLKDAEKRLQELKDAGAQSSSNLMLREAYNHAQRLVDKLREARRAQAELAAAPYTDGMGNSSIILGQRKSLDDQARAALDATKNYQSLAERMNAVRETGDKAREALKALELAGQGTSKQAEQLRDRIKGVDEQLAKMAKSGSGGASALTQQANAYQALADKAAEYVQSLQIQAQQGSKLSQSQKLQIELDSLLAKGKGKVSAAAVAQIQASIAIAKAMEGEALAVKRAQESYQDYLQDQEDWAKYQREVEDATNAMRIAVVDQNIALDDQMRLLELEASLMGASSAAREIAIEKLRVQIELEKELRDISNNTTLDGAGKQEAEAAARARAVKKIAIAERKVYVSEWEKTSQLIGDTLADYIMGGGKDAAQYLKRLFSTLVLQPVVQGVVGGLMGQGGAAGASGTGSGSFAGVANTASSLYSMATSPMLQNFGLAAAGNIQQLGGTLFTKGFETAGTAIVDFGNTVAQYSDLINTAGNVLGYASAFYNLTQGKVGAAIGTAIGTTVGGPIGSFIGSTLGSLVDSVFAGDSGTPHTGAGAIYKDGAVSGGKSIFNGANFNFGAKWSEQAQSSVTAIAGGIGSALDSVATSFGQKAGYSIYTAFADDSSSDGAWGSLKIADADGEVLVDWQDTRRSKWAPKEFADGEEGYKQYLQAVSDDVKNAFLAMDLPAWADNILAAATDLDTLNAALSQIAVNKAGFDALAASMSMFKGISEELQTQLLATAGSMDTLTSVAGSYYGSSMYTEGERMLSARQQQMDALASMGLYIDPAEGEKAKALFRKTVEEAMATGQGELAVKLMAMSASFAQVADYATKLFDDVETAARDAAEAARELALANAENVVDGAWRNFEAAIDREKAYWQGIASASQEAIGQITGSVQLLQSTARDLYGTVDSAQQMLAAQGMVYVENALAAVRAGASITGFDGLQEAITAARGGISGGVYASEFERQRDTLVLAGQLSELGDLGDAQLSVEEMALEAAQEQIEQLDATLEYWQQQLDGTAQLIDTGLSIESAISALSAAITARDAIQNASGGGGGGGSAGGASTDSVLQKVGDAWASGDWITAQNYIRGQGISNQQLQDAFDLSYADLRYLYNKGITSQNPGTYVFKADTAEGIYNEAKAQGLTLSEVDKILGAGAGEAEEWAKKMGLPIFHGGTPYVQRTGFAVLQEGEAVVPKALNPWVGGAGGQQQGSNSELVAQNQALQAKVEKLEAQLVRVANATERLADQFDNATAGGNAMAVEVMA